MGGRRPHNPATIYLPAESGAHRAPAFPRPASEPGQAGRRAAHLRSEARRPFPRPDSHTKDDQGGKQGERRDHYTHALTCGFRARGRIRTDDLPITRRMLGVDLDGSRRIEPAHVGWPVGLDGSRRIQTDRVDDHRDDQGASDTGSRRDCGSFHCGGYGLFRSARPMASCNCS